MRRARRPPVAAAAAKLAAVLATLALAPTAARAQMPRFDHVIVAQRGVVSLRSRQML